MHLIKKLFSGLGQRGVIHLLPLLLILAGIIGGVYLVQNPQIFKPKADAPTIQWVPRSSDNDPENCITGVDKNNYAIAVCSKLKLKFNLPDQSSDASFQIVKTAYASHGPDTEDWYCAGTYKSEVWHSKIYKAEDNDNWFDNIFHFIGGDLHEKIKNCSEEIDANGVSKVCKEFQTSGYKVNAGCFPRDEEPGQPKPAVAPSGEQSDGQATGSQNPPANVSPKGSTSEVGTNLVFHWVKGGNSTRTIKYRFIVDPVNSEEDDRRAVFNDCPKDKDTDYSNYFICADNKPNEVLSKYGLGGAEGGIVGFPSANFKDGIIYTWWVDALDANGDIINSSKDTPFIVYKTTGVGATSPSTPAGVGTTEPVTPEVAPSPAPAAGGIAERAKEIVKKIVCEDKKETYGQCGGTIGLKNEDPTHVFEVTKVTDCRGNPKPYLKADKGFLDQCQKEAVARGDIPAAPPQGGPAVTVAPTVTTAPAASGRIVKYRYQVSYPPIKQSGWINITGGDILIDTESASTGTQTIYFEFADSNGQIVEVDGKSSVDAYVIFKAPGTITIPTTNPEATQVPTAAPTTPPAAECPVSNWQNYNIPTLKTMCTFQQLSTLPVSALVDFENKDLLMMTNESGKGISFLESLPVDRLIKFDLTVIGTLSCSKYTLLPKSIQDQIGKDCYTTVGICTPKVTSCTCDNPDPLSSRYPGKCYPDCNGGWCKSGICDTCKP